MKPGPKPTPTKLLMLRGSKYARRKDHEPNLGGRAPAIPDYLKSVDEKKAWYFTVKQLSSAGLLSRIDQFALGRYVRLYIQWRKMDEFVAEYGEVYPIVAPDHAKPLGFGVFPQAVMARKYADMLLRLECEFGMTPSARASLGMALTPAPGKTSGEKSKDRFFQD